MRRIYHYRSRPVPLWMIAELSFYLGVLAAIVLVVLSELGVVS